jgi:hypothetical protein
MVGLVGDVESILDSKGGKEAIMGASLIFYASKP